MILILLLLILCVSCTPPDDVIISLAKKNESLSGYNWLIKTYRDYNYKCPEDKETLYQFALRFIEGIDMDEVSLKEYMDYANSLNKDNVYYCTLNDSCFLYNSKTGVGCVEYCRLSKLINDLENPAEREVHPRFFDNVGNPIFIDSFELEKRILLLTRLFPGRLVFCYSVPPLLKKVLYREVYSYSNDAITPVSTDVECNCEQLRWVINNELLNFDEQSQSTEYMNCLLQIMREWCDSYPNVDSIVFPLIFVCGEKDNERVYLEDFPIEERQALINSIGDYDLFSIDGLKSAIDSSCSAAFYEFNNSIEKESQTIYGELVLYWLTKCPSFVLDYLEYDHKLRIDYLQLLSAFFIEKPEEYESFKNRILLNHTYADFLYDLDIMIMKSNCTQLSTIVQ